MNALRVRNLKTPEQVAGLAAWNVLEDRYHEVLTDLVFLWEDIERSMDAYLEDPAVSKFEAVVNSFFACTTYLCACSNFTLVGECYDAFSELEDYIEVARKDFVFG